jgi:DNA helicase IV
MDTLAARINKIMDRWGDAQPDPAADGMRALRETMGYRIEVIAPIGVRFDDAERRMIELTEEQSYIRDFVRRQPRLAVMGTAGSGKTLIAIQTAVWLAQNGHRTLFTCLNKRLGRYIAEMTSAEENIRASHFHALAYELAREADLIEEQSDLALPGETTYFSDDLPAALKQAAEVLDTRFDAIVVDEAQDFQEQYWEGLLAFHSSSERTPLYLFADDNQNIYEGGTLPIQPNEVFGPLRRNMRNSREIQQFLLALHSHEDAPIVSGPEVGPVRVMAYSDAEDLAKKSGDLLTELLGQGVALDDIVLLTPSTVAKSALRSRPEIGGISISEDELPETLLTSTLHGFKGLEKSVVILAELGERGEKRLVEYLYVGGSRARFQLILLAVPKVADMLEQLLGTPRIH